MEVKHTIISKYEGQRSLPQGKVRNLLLWISSVNFRVNHKTQGQVDEKLMFKENE